MKVTFDKDEIELTDTSVIIRRMNASSQMATGASGYREIRIDGITAVALKAAGFLPGYIVISYAGSKPFRGGWVEASQDPDGFVFRKSENDTMVEFKRRLETAITEIRNRPARSGGLGEEFERLAKLYRDGALSETEFQQAKAKVLGA